MTGTKIAGFFLNFRFLELLISRSLIMVRLSGFTGTVFSMDGTVAQRSVNLNVPWSNSSAAIDIPVVFISVGDDANMDSGGTNTKVFH